MLLLRNMVMTRLHSKEKKRRYMYIGYEIKKNKSTEGCSKLKRSIYMTSSGKNGLNIRTNASPKLDRTRCPEE